jgi:hypothetical protein
LRCKPLCILCLYPSTCPAPSPHPESLILHCTLLAEGGQPCCSVKVRVVDQQGSGSCMVVHILVDVEEHAANGTGRAGQVPTSGKQRRKVWSNACIQRLQPRIRLYKQTSFGSGGNNRKHLDVQVRTLSWHPPWPRCCARQRLVAVMAVLLFLNCCQCNAQLPPTKYRHDALPCYCH